MVDLRECRWEVVEVDAGALIFGVGPQVGRQRVQWVAQVHRSDIVLDIVTGCIN